MTNSVDIYEPVDWETPFVEELVRQYKARGSQPQNAEVVEYIIERQQSCVEPLREMIGTAREIMAKQSAEDWKTAPALVIVSGLKLRDPQTLLSTPEMELAPHVEHAVLVPTEACRLPKALEPAFPALNPEDDLLQALRRTSHASDGRDLSDCRLVFVVSAQTITRVIKMGQILSSIRPVRLENLSIRGADKPRLN